MTITFNIFDMVSTLVPDDLSPMQGPCSQLYGRYPVQRLQNMRIVRKMGTIRRAFGTVGVEDVKKWYSRMTG